MTSFEKENVRIAAVAAQLGLTLPDNDSLTLLPVMEELTRRVLLVEDRLDLLNWLPKVKNPDALGGVSFDMPNVVSGQVIAWPRKPA